MLQLKITHPTVKETVCHNEGCPGGASGKELPANAEMQAESLTVPKDLLRFPALACSGGCWEASQGWSQQSSQFGGGGEGTQGA